jgi:integrase
MGERSIYRGKEAVHRKNARRAYGDGSIYYDCGRDRWVGVVELGRDGAGRRRRSKVTGHTEAEAIRRVRRLRGELDAGQVGFDKNLTLGAWLDHWLVHVVEARVDSPNTVENYRWALSHVRPSLGARRLAKLTVEDVERLLASKSAMSRNSVARIRRVLADALRSAERREYVARNVAALAELPRCKPPGERRSLTAEEARLMLDAAAHERLGAVFACGLMLGLRPGELAGLRWEDVDLDGATLRVSGSLKEEGHRLRLGDVKRSRAGWRTLAMPPVLVGLLRQHHRRQAAERLAPGEAWQDHVGLVFCSELGTPLDPSNLRRVTARVARRAGIPGSVFPYLMRHAAASLLLDAGASLEQVADVLGDHPETLLRHYRHRVRPVADAAAAPMQAMFGAPAEAS